MTTSRLRRLGELARLFAKLGVIGFGGPAAHIAMMEDEVVERRKWLTRDYFLDLIGATNLIPGPNSTEMAAHVGFARAGWAGLLVAGPCFVLPAVLITAALAWAYVHYGALPQVGPLLYGIKPAVIAVIAVAVWRLGSKAAKSAKLVIIGAAVTAASVAGLDAIAALIAGSLLGMLWLRLSAGGRRADGGAAAVPALLLGAARKSCAQAAGVAGAAGAAGVAAATGAVPLWQLGLFFLKVGAVLYGGGYVLVAFLQGGVVHDYGWLTQQQLLDAIAIGQFTPGPVLSTATFIGYLIAGGPGAVVATLAIFLPSFLFVGFLNPLVPKLRKSRWMAAFLDAVNISAIGLMLAVTAKLGTETLRTWPACVIAVLAAAVGIRWKLNAAWLVLGGAILGLALSGTLNA
jgi:chromate transporter